MKKQDIILDLYNTISKIGVICTKCGIPNTLVQDRKAEFLTIAELKSLDTGKMEAITDKLIAVRNLRTDDQWNFYKMFESDCTTMREVIMMKEARQAFRKELKAFESRIKAAIKAIK